MIFILETVLSLQTTAGITAALSRSQLLGQYNATDDLSEKDFNLAEFQASPPTLYSCGSYPSMLPLKVRCIRCPSSNFSMFMFLLQDEASMPYYTAYIPNDLMDQV
jgi:hypothetical protein